MNALATRNCSSKPLFNEAKFDQIEEELPFMSDAKRRMESLPDKLSHSCDDLLECSYGEFEKDLRNNCNSFSSSACFIQINESNFPLSEVNEII